MRTETGTDLIIANHLVVVLVLLGVTVFKSLRLRRFKSDRDGLAGLFVK